ncbi:MAG: DUF420 domain-containing protein [Armatimonadetes bacterium]|nr:DUF420 domain-containing protein [Armatimonadota bacterium]MDW8121823.1 DUF420 domain-containing protein [Armatimonadota bacterium]
MHGWATINAGLNLCSAILALAGFFWIRRGQVNRHRLFMLGAFLASAAFFISYVIYHSMVGATPFPGQGIWRPVYFFILISHTLLACGVVPLVLVSLFRALRQDFSRHRKIARWALPIWIYVSVTGVIIYVMLYHLFSASTKR